MLNISKMITKIKLRYHRKMVDANYTLCNLGLISAERAEQNMYRHTMGAVAMVLLYEDKKRQALES